MFRILLIFVLSAHSAWASDISIKFHENSRVLLVDGQFITQAQRDEKSAATTTPFIKSDNSETGFINNLIATTPLLPNRSGALVRPSFSAITDEQLATWKANAEKFWEEELEDLSLYFSVSISDKEQDHIDEYLALEKLDIVESVEFIPTPEPAIATPSFEGNQGYLGNSTNGVYAKNAWNLDGGKGNTIKLVDIEGAWITNHEDFPSLFYTSGGFTSDVGWQRHGTAVIGVVGAKDNGIGVTGIASSANFGVESFYKNNQGLASAITMAALTVGYGGVIIIEVQFNASSSYTPICTCNFGQCGYVPAEYYSSHYNAIKQAVGNGVVVVEASGNGTVNLDHSSFGGIFNRSVRDSGAIFVGASLSTSRAPSCFTNYGSRIDVHGWGDSVATLSYGDIFNQAGETRDYTGAFSGTSSASPIVAGAATSIQGILKAHGKSVLNSTQMRSLLNSTGTPQTSVLSKNIGRLPNIIQAVESKGVNGFNPGAVPPVLYLQLLD